MFVCLFLQSFMFSNLGNTTLCQTGLWIVFSSNLNNKISFLGLPNLKLTFFYFFYFLIMLWTEELRIQVSWVFINLWHLHHLTFLTIHEPYRLMNVWSSWNLLFGFSILLKSAAFSCSHFGSWFFPPLQDCLTITDTLSRSATTLACPCTMYTYPENPCCEDIYSQPNIASVRSGIFF